MHTFDLKAEELRSSIKLKMFKRPPLNDENSDLFPCKILANPLDFTSSGKDYPEIILLKESVIY